MAEIVRVIRVLEYVGPREWLEKGLAQRSVKGEMSNMTHSGDKWTIREAILGDFPELIQHEEWSVDRQTV